jgi:hypothetical protein
MNKYQFKVVEEDEYYKVDGFVMENLGRCGWTLVSVIRNLEEPKYLIYYFQREICESN